jgi:hypothetical protein
MGRASIFYPVLHWVKRMVPPVLKSSHHAKPKILKLNIVVLQNTLVDKYHTLQHVSPCPMDGRKIRD